MKGKIIDYNAFESFVLLDDDTIMRIPNTNDYSPLTKSTMNLDLNKINCNANNHSAVSKNNLIDFY